jgi:hypothetical protein
LRYLQDSILAAGVREHNNSWVRIAPSLPGHSDMNCRNRWRTIEMRINPKNVPLTAEEVGR